MKRLTPEMRAAVGLSIRDRHHELLTLIESDISRILEGSEDHKPEDHLGKSLILFKQICHDEFKDLESELYILSIVFSDLVAEIDAGRLEVRADRIEMARRMAMDP
jgi:hypothetical protein